MAPLPGPNVAPSAPKSGPLRTQMAPFPDPIGAPSGPKWLLPDQNTPVIGNRRTAFGLNS